MKKFFTEDRLSQSPQLSMAVSIAGSMQEPVLVLDPNQKILAASKAFCQTFEESPSNLYDTTLEAWGNGFSAPAGLYQYVKDGGQTGIRSYTFQKGDFQKKFLVNIGVVSTGEEGEDLSLISFKEQAGENKTSHKLLQEVMEHAPALICVLREPEHIFELANENYMKLVGHRDLIGKSVKETLPEVENQGFIKILNQVYETGEPYIGSEIGIQLKTGSVLSNHYLDFVYQPLKTNGKVEGIFVHAIDVTEKVETRQKLLDHRDELRNIVDTVPAIIWITDAQGKSTTLNYNWEEFTGQPVTEALKMGWLNEVHPEDRQRVKNRFLECNRDQKKYSVTFRLRTKSGGYRYVLDKGAPSYDTAGKFKGFIGTVVDVHDDRIKEQLVREKEHKMSSIVEQATVATAVYTGLEMKIDMANDAMIKLWGKDQSVIGKTLREALPELEGQPFHDLLEGVFTTGEIYWGKEDKVDLEIDGKLQTGYFNFTYKPLRDEQGKIYGILNMALDVTEQVNIRKKIQESELYYRQMADLMPDKVINTDPEGLPLYFNQIWLEYTGMSGEELRNKNWTSLVHPEDKERFLEQWNSSLKSGEKFETEIRIADKDQNFTWHLSRAEAVKDNSGNIKMWIGTNTEIQRLKEEEKRKEDFLKMVSHELKTPVTSIKGYVQLLLKILSDLQVEELENIPLKPSLERINHQIKRLTRLISEMLDLSRIEEGKLDLQKENFSINELVNDTLQDIALTNTKHTIKVEHDLKARVFADKDRIGQVLINFVTNAIKYSPESRHVKVEVTSAGNQRVAVKVIDEGLGINEKDHENIFKRFYRIGNENEETYSGFGIGLYLAKEIIERHSGEIEVKSQKGKGSEFSFILSTEAENSF